MTPDTAPKTAARKESLRRELAAIAVLYGFLAILPLLVGLSFRP